MGYDVSIYKNVPTTICMNVNITILTVWKDERYKFVFYAMKPLLFPAWKGVTCLTKNVAPIETLMIRLMAFYSLKWQFNY